MCYLNISNATKPNLILIVKVANESCFLININLTTVIKIANTKLYYTLIELA